MHYARRIDHPLGRVAPPHIRVVLIPRPEHLLRPTLRVCARRGGSLVNQSTSQPLTQPPKTQPPHHHPPASTVTPSCPPALLPSCPPALLPSCLLPPALLPSILPASRRGARQQPRHVHTHTTVTTTTNRYHTTPSGWSARPVSASAQQHAGRAPRVTSTCCCYRYYRYCCYHDGRAVATKTGWQVTNAARRTTTTPHTHNIAQLTHPRTRTLTHIHAHAHAQKNNCSFDRRVE
ncbi:hypothetical protein BC628DRAFT_1095397 [Trametes gibbosa]|nr:hypothetical protein BC628DRAFT_1095397 [Trametes gibbosa]